MSQIWPSTDFYDLCDSYDSYDLFDFYDLCDSYDSYDLFDFYDLF